MRADSQKERGVSINKTKRDAVPPVYSYAPHLFSMRLKLFCMQRRMKWILSKVFLLLFGLI